MPPTFHRPDRAEAVYARRDLVAEIEAHNALVIIQRRRGDFSLRYRNALVELGLA